MSPKFIHHVNVERCPKRRAVIAFLQLSHGCGGVNTVSRADEVLIAAVYLFGLAVTVTST